MRKRWFHIVLVEKDFTVEVRDRLCSSHFIHKWAYVRHIDADMCPHYHVYVEFGCSAYEGAFLAEKGQKQCAGNDKQRHHRADHTAQLPLIAEYGEDQQQRHAHIGKRVAGGT